MYSIQNLRDVQKNIKPYYSLLQVLNRRDYHFNAVSGMVTFEVIISNMLSQDNWDEFNADYDCLRAFKKIYTNPANDHKLMFFLENIEMSIDGYLMSIDHANQ